MKNWEMVLGDCVEGLSEQESESAGYAIFSPPFGSLYVYSNSPKDMGNVASDDEFFERCRWDDFDEAYEVFAAIDPNGRFADQVRWNRQNG